MSVYPAIFGLVACFLAYRYGAYRCDCGLPVTLGHRVWVGLMVWAAGITALCLAPILTSGGPFPSPEGRLAAISACLVIGWAPLVVGLLTMMALRHLCRLREDA